MGTSVHVLSLWGGERGWGEGRGGGKGVGKILPINLLDGYIAVPHFQHSIAKQSHPPKYSYTHTYRRIHARTHYTCKHTSVSILCSSRSQLKVHVLPYSKHKITLMIRKEIGTSFAFPLDIILFVWHF